MKPSIFNSRLHISEHIDVLFNALVQSIRFVDRNFNFSDVLSLPENQMTEWTDAGFIVNDDCDEYESAVAIFNSSMNDSSSFKLTINPTLNCNFRCWYCYETHKKTAEMTEETLDKVKALISNIIKAYTKIELSFFGGEPFLRFNDIVRPLIEYTASECNNADKEYILSFTTNGFLITLETIQWLTNYKCTHFQITLDGGPSFHNKTRVSKEVNSFERIVHNIKLLAGNGIKVLLRINLTRENLSSSFEIPKYFNDTIGDTNSNIQLFLQQVWQDKAEEDISDRLWTLREEFLKVGIRHSPMPADYIRNICYGDKIHSAVVNYDGNIFKCTAIDFEKENPFAYINKDGEIIETDLNFKCRNDKRFLREKCRTCRIMPLCFGGCSKSIMNADTSHCKYEDNEELKDNVVKHTVKELMFDKLHEDMCAVSTNK